jgi:hypothetical protein
LKTLHGSMHAVYDTAYFEITVSYTCKVFMKYATGVNVKKHFYTFVIGRVEK